MVDVLKVGFQCDTVPVVFCVFVFGKEEVHKLKKMMMMTMVVVMVMVLMVMAVIVIERRITEGQGH